MPTKPTHSLIQMTPRHAWSLIILFTLVPAVLLLASFKALNELGWPGWLVWVGRVLAVGAVAVLWQSSAWPLLQALRRRRR